MHLISLWFEVEGSQCHSHSPDFFMCITWLSIPISVRKFSSVYSNIHLHVHSFQQIFVYYELGWLDLRVSKIKFPLYSGNLLSAG